MSLVKRIKDFVSAYPDLYDKGKILASAYAGSTRKRITSEKAKEERREYGRTIWKTYCPQIVAIPAIALCSLIVADEATYALGLHHTAIFPTWDMQMEYAVNAFKGVKSLDQIDSDIAREHENKIFTGKSREERILDSRAAYEELRPYIELRKDHPPFTHMLESAESKIATLR